MITGNRLFPCHSDGAGILKGYTTKSSSAYYEKRKSEGKTSQQALICISRRLISIIYGMLKNSTEYRMPVGENAGENV